MGGGRMKEEGKIKGNKRENKMWKEKGKVKRKKRR